MKKTVALILVLLLVLGSVPALCAEEFSLRNGVKFGDTIEEVRAKETVAIDEDESSDTRLWTEEGTVAGINGVKLLYAFDENGGLEEVKWELPDWSTADSSDDDYEKLYRAMKGKYGEPLGYSNGDCYIITGTAISGAALLSYLYNSLDSGVGDIRDYAEWDYEYTDTDHVKIELVQFYYGASYSQRKFYNFVGYKHFTDEDLRAARQEKQEENQAVTNDI